MTVLELINLLEQMDETLPVYMEGCGTSEWGEPTVELVYEGTTEMVVIS